MNRRAFLAGTATAGAGALAGCLDAFDSGGSVPEPVALTGGKFDDDHGMEIGPHGGANAQIFYKSETPSEREEGPFWFHTLVFSGFPFYFEHDNRGWEMDVFYVTDYSNVDWTIQERDSGSAMPSPMATETFGDATEMTYVGGSDVMGGMGPGLHPFSKESDAKAFADDYGGETVVFDDIDRGFVENLREK
ncbi:nitrous oxide reductase accessory protein NosL [Halovenus rubra]|uniref:Nitrous oxide reductase accessory protein NosL n=2 Tax=Halovenus rubra TaxID=869890 RepID=A0ABD5X8K8_9EURY|nr:nitrous oxide reductase accessory protein NosL [Halovenus rubra]